MPRFEVPPCAGRLPGRPDNRAVHKNILEVGVIRQRIGNALENASPGKAPEDRATDTPSAPAETVPSPFIVKPALFCLLRL